MSIGRFVKGCLKAGTFCLSDVSCKGRFVCDPTVYTNSDSIQKYTYFEVALKCVSDLQYTASTIQYLQNVGHEQEQ